MLMKEEVELSLLPISSPKQASYSIFIDEDGDQMDIKRLTFDI
jgi:hypothetical protein